MHFNLMRTLCTPPTPLLMIYLCSHVQRNSQTSLMSLKLLEARIAFNVTCESGRRHEESNFLEKCVREQSYTFKELYELFRCKDFQKLKSEKGFKTTLHYPVRNQFKFFKKITFKIKKVSKESDRKSDDIFHVTTLKDLLGNKISKIN